MGKEAKHVVRLTAEERKQLQDLITKGGRAATILKRARILLKADEGKEGPTWSDERVAEFSEVSLSTTRRIRQRFVEEGFEAALYRKPTTDRQYRKLDGKGEAHLIALTCSAPPEGRVRWTLRLLADRLVALEVVDEISGESVRRTLKKTTSSLG